MLSVDRLIAGAASWAAFFARAAALPASAPGRAPDKGKVFERLTQLYLKTHPEYQTRLRHVWRVRDELPPAVRSRVRLPRADEGVDLVAETFDGDLWAIQCKFRADTHKPLTVTELSTFTNLAFNVCRGFALAVVAHTCSKPVRKAALLGRATEIGLDRWLDLDADDWRRLRAAATRKAPPPPEPRAPRPHQQHAVAAAREHFVARKAARGRLIMPCGTGKSLTAFWIAEALGARSILVAVPSLSLIKQSLADWTREFLAHGEVPDWLCVCGDESTARLEHDEFVGGVYELGVPATTDPKAIAAFLSRGGARRKIVFATYQSGKPLAAAARAAGFAFDLGIMDEAHRTVGSPGKAFGHLLLARNIRVARRLFMTATERVVRGADETVLSMDDPAVYGECFHQLSFKQAIAARPPIISDYRILTITVSDERVKRLIAENRSLRTADRELGEREAQALAAGIALQRAFREEGVRHAISFHRSIRAAEQFRDQQQRIEAGRRRAGRPACYHISSRKTAGERADLLREFRESPAALITNARCLQEGVDIPAVDCVLFADPKQSVVDIVQAAGRAMRPSKGKRYGYIVVPIVVPSGMSFAEFAEPTEFKQVARVVTALSTQDDRIKDELQGLIGTVHRRGAERIVDVAGDVPLAMHIDLEDFRDHVRLKLWERVGRANRRPFADARAFAHSLALRHVKEWFTYCRGDREDLPKLPADIPTSPRQVYGPQEWKDWGDWLGTGRRKGGMRAFADARKFVHTLHLETHSHWNTYCRGGLNGFTARPLDVPANPTKTYPKEWRGWSDWLGIEGKHPWRPYPEARKFARALSLPNNGAWRLYVSGKLAGKRLLPHGIPRSPDTTYAGRGWTSWGDFLGTRNLFKPKYRSFEHARRYAQRLRLRSLEEWTLFTHGRLQGKPKRPADIPMSPDDRYRGEGWTSWPDWLGTAANWLPFAKARKYAQSLKLRNGDAWKEHVRAVQRRRGGFGSSLPRTPDLIYRTSGWKGWNDFLGTGRRVPGKRGSFLPFGDARAFVHRLKLANAHEWREWSAGRYRAKGLRPQNIPSSPAIQYKSTGWRGWGDWLGTGNLHGSRSARSRDERPL